MMSLCITCKQTWRGLLELLQFRLVTARSEAQKYKFVENRVQIDARCVVYLSSRLPKQQFNSNHGPQIH